MANPLVNGVQSKTSVNPKNGLRRTVIKGIKIGDLTDFDEQRQAEAFDELIAHHVPNLDTSKFSITMSYPGMQKPCYLGFRDYKGNTGITIVKRLEALIQSNEFVKPDQNLTFEILVIENARRRPQLESQAIVGHRPNGQKGKRIPYVCNLNDPLCLPRAVAVAFAHGGIMTLLRDYGAKKEADLPASVKKLYNKRKADFKWLTNLKDPRTDERQKIEALDILEKCGIAKDKECYDVEDLKRIYETFKGFSEFENLGYPPFSFHVFTFEGVLIKSMEDPQHKADQHPLLFLHYNRHMDFAKDLLHKKKVFCHLCHLVYGEKRRHFCRDRCFLCDSHAGKCQAVPGEGRVCSDCNFYFDNAECFASHKRTAIYSNSPEASLYTQRHRCVVEGGCGKAFHVDKANPHDCRLKYCSKCGEKKDIDHACTWKKVGKKEARDMAARCKKFKSLLFDFETMQNDVNDKDEIVLFPDGHVPIWAGAVTVCDQCADTEIDLDGKNECKNCGGERLFERTYEPGLPKSYVIDEFVKYFFCQKRFDGFSFYAHNFSGFDAMPIQQKLLSMGVAPDVITQGTRILQMKVSPSCFNEDRAVEIAEKTGKPKMENPIEATVVLKDTWLFTQCPLSEFSKTFDLEEQKGEFPYSLICDKYWKMDQKGLPDKKWYEADMRKPRAFKDFNRWYDENKEMHFNLVKELKRYGWSDVIILMKGYLKLRKTFIEYCKFDPFVECITLAATSLLAFRLNFLDDPSMIAHIDERGVPLSDNQSMLALRYLLWYEKVKNEERAKAGLPPWRMRTALDEENEASITLDNGTCYKIDGVWMDSEGNGYGIEVQGCWWHGCPQCTSNLTKEKEIEDAESRLHDTRRKIDELEKGGYRVLQVWEHEIEEMLDEDPEMKKFFEENDCKERLFPRAAYFGGKTYTSQLIKECKDGEEIGFGDFSSLYPFVMLRGKFPKGAPLVIKKYQQPGRVIPLPPPRSKTDYKGLILCRVLIDADNKLAVLPYRYNKQLYFGNCARCCQLEWDGVCEHAEKEREFTGVFTHEELNEAISLGADIKEIIEVWHWLEWIDSEKLFGGFVRTFYRMKIANSGWGDRHTPEARKKFLEDLKDKMGIELKESEIKENKALRFLSKLLLNSLFGKFGQKIHRSTTEYVSDRERIVQIATDPKLKVTAHHFIPSTFEGRVVDEEAILMMTYHTRQEYEHSCSFANLPIACFITSYARLELFKVIKAVGDHHLYSDTDSIAYVKNSQTEAALKPYVHSFLGGLESEVKEGWKMTRLVAPSAKCYGYRQERRDDPKTFVDTMKIRGVMLHQQAQDSLNLDGFCKHVQNYVSEVCQEKNVDLEGDSLEERQRKKPVSAQGLPVHEYKQRIFKRNQHRILTQQCMKQLKIHQHKGVLDLYTTRVYPFGYKARPNAPVGKMARINGGEYDETLLAFM